MINWGILGLGNMGKEFINCFAHPFQKINIIGVASKSNSKISNLKNQINLIQFDSYESLISSENIDAIYIATLNNTHKDLVLAAIKKNKKILCEKPLGLNTSQVLEVDTILKDKKDNFYEAIAYRSHPQTSFLMSLVKDKEMGRIIKIESNFGFKKRIDKRSRHFNKELGGGSILDLGCYPISFFNLFNNLDDQMKIIDTKVNFCETNVDIDAEIVININENIKAIGKVSLRENLNNISKIYFEKATITVPQPWTPKEKTFLEIETKSRYFKKIINTDKNVYAHQVMNVSDAFMGGKNNFLVNIDESLKISKVLDSWLKNKH
jgi:predicted dehydrogenase